jgi:hypothetical protein
MDWSTTHKVKIIGTLILIIIAISSVIIYFKYIQHDPTCTDGIKNQDERGIDCGGVCKLMCVADVKPLIPLWTRPLKITGDVYSVVSYIENQNIGNGVKKVPYELRLYDDKNILVSQPIKGETFIGPNDRTAIFETAIKVGNRIPKTAFLKFLQQPEFIRINERFNDQNLVAEGDVLSDLETSPKIAAVVRNKTIETFKSIPVVAIVYDSEGNALAASQTFIDEIGPEESVNVYFSWPEPFSGAAARREIIPRINPFIQPTAY